jgi:hypothetical protein
VALKPLMEAKKQGFHDNLFLELETYNKGSSLDSAILQVSHNRVQAGKNNYVSIYSVS